MNGSATRIATIVFPALVALPLYSYIPHHPPYSLLLLLHSPPSNRWFISSEGILVVAGRNAADNEALVKRYMRPQDVYVHADVHGAATVVVRHPSHDPAAQV